MPKTRATTVTNVTSLTVTEVEAAKALLALKKSTARPKRKCAVYTPGKYREECEQGEDD